MRSELDRHLRFEILLIRNRSKISLHSKPRTQQRVCFVPCEFEPLLLFEVEWPIVLLVLLLFEAIEVLPCVAIHFLLYLMRLLLNLIQA